MSKTTEARAEVTHRRSGAEGWGRAGDLVGVVVNLAMLVAVNVWPGWRSVPFLTEDLVEALPLVNLSLAAGAVAGLVYYVAGAPLVRALGGLVTTSIGLAAAVRMLQVFPFEAGGVVPVVAAVLLVLAVIGSVIAIAVQLAATVRAVAQAR